MECRLSKHPELKRIINAITLNRLDSHGDDIKKKYRGHFCRVESTELCRVHGLEWNGGSKSEYWAVNLETLKVEEYHNRVSFLDQRYPAIQMVENVAIVETGWFCGKQMCPTIYFHPNNMNKLLD